MAAEIVNHRLVTLLGDDVQIQFQRSIVGAIAFKYVSYIPVSYCITTPNEFVLIDKNPEKDTIQALIKELNITHLHASGKKAFLTLDSYCLEGIELFLDPVEHLKYECDQCLERSCAITKAKYCMRRALKKFYFYMPHGQDTVYARKCTICLDESPCEIWTKCKHAYHIQCLAKWKENNCPMCRQNLS